MPLSTHSLDRNSFEQLQPRTIVCVLGTLAAVSNLSLQPTLGDTFTVWLVPAVIMSVALLGGWMAAAICAVMTVLAGILGANDLYEVAACSTTALAGGEALRRGVRPIVVALLQALVVALTHTRLLGGPEPITLMEIGAAALANSCINVTAATATLIVMPRQSAIFQRRCRIRWDHVVFTLTAGTLSVAAIALVVGTRPDPFVTGQGWGAHAAIRVGGLLLAACVATLALTSRFNAIAGRLLRRLRTARHAPTQAGSRRVPGELPLEMAPFFIELRRETSRLRRRAAQHSRERSELQAEIQRLTREASESRRELEIRSGQLRKLARSTEHARARYQALMEQSPDVTLFADSKGMIRSASRSAVRMLGYQPVELEGKPLGTLIPEGHASGHPLDVSGKTPQRGAVSLTDTTVRSQSGKEKQVAALVRAFQIRDTNHYVIQLRDTGRMKKALATLEQAKSLTQSAHRSRDLFVAAMSHELRTPLHGLIATLDMMRLGDHSSPELQQRLTIARVSARTLLKIANDILDLSRIDSGHFPLEQHPFNPRTTIEEVIDESRARAESQGLTLDARFTDTLPPAFIGDSGRLKQILNNLVSNALKFTRTGGVTLQMSYDEGGHWTIDVIDTGDGVPRDKWNSIFDPFIQVESGTRRHVGGTGLGLPISRRLAEAMGGSLTLLRSDTRGSTFRLTVLLPASKEPPPSEQSQRIFRNPRGRILVVEDNAANRYVAEALLANLDCPVTIVEGGVEAIELVQKSDFDLILMDCQMPGLDGFETTRRIRRILKRHVPIIAMTANAMAEDKKHCLEAGMDDFLPKPFGCQALNGILCKWLEPSCTSKRDTEELEARIERLPVVDVDVFNELRHSLQWKQEPLRRICTTFTESAQSALSAIQGNCGEHLDRRALRRHLHTLLGSAGMVGARQAEYIARKIRGDLQANRVREIGDALELLKSALRRFESEFERQLNAGVRGHHLAAVAGERH